MVLAFGRYLLFREATHGSWIAIVALVAVVLLARFWPRVIAWIERKRRSR